MNNDFDITAICEEYYKGILLQREEILKAFIAKFGCHPEEVVQVIEGTKTYVRRRTPEEMEMIKNLDATAKMTHDLIGSLKAAKEQLRIAIEALQHYAWVDNYSWNDDKTGEKIIGDGASYEAKKALEDIKRMEKI